MGRGKKYQPEQVVNLLRQIEVAVSNGKTTPQACKEAGIVEQTYFRWRKEYGGLQIDQAKRLRAMFSKLFSASRSRAPASDAGSRLLLCALPLDQCQGPTFYEQQNEVLGPERGSLQGTRPTPSSFPCHQSDSASARVLRRRVRLANRGRRNLSVCKVGPSALLRRFLYRESHDRTFPWAHSSRTHRMSQ